jgi:hypothetical protein
MCRELGRELDRRGDGRVSARLQEELRVGFERFVELRNERLENPRPLLRSPTGGSVGS